MDTVALLRALPLRSLPPSRPLSPAQAGGLSCCLLPPKERHAKGTASQPVVSRHSTGAARATCAYSETMCSYSTCIQYAHACARGEACCGTARRLLRARDGVGGARTQRGVEAFVLHAAAEAAAAGDTYSTQPLALYKNGPQLPSTPVRGAGGIAAGAPAATQCLHYCWQCATLLRRSAGWLCGAPAAGVLRLQQRRQWHSQSASRHSTGAARAT